jgi:hypothetical protein
MEDAERARLRRQALGWLADDLAARLRAMKDGWPADQASPRQLLSQWQFEPALARFRTEDVVAGCPAEERAEWKSLWARVKAAAKSPTARCRQRQYPVPEAGVQLTPGAFGGKNRRCHLSRATRRQVIRAGIAVGTTLVTGISSPGSEPEKFSVLDLFLPELLKKEDIQAKKVKDGTFTKLQFAGATFWLKRVNLGYGVAHTFIGIYAPDKDGVFHRSLTAESWDAVDIEATVNAKTGILELRERADSDLKGQLVLSCNLKTIGTQHSIRAK